MAEQEWQPIETAPRDGTDVLLYFPLVGLHESWSRTLIGHWVKDADDGYWVFQGRAFRGYSAPFLPSHFQPLPAPPIPHTPA